MKFTKIITGFVAAVAVAAMSFGNAMAATTTFANFSQQVSNSTPFTFTNTGSTSTFTVNTQVFFKYAVANGYNAGVNNNISATMIMTATVSGPVAPTGTSDGDFISQPLGAVQIQFIANTPYMGQTNLLTVNATSAALRGTQGDGAPQLSLTGVTFTSSYLDFHLTTTRNGSLSFSGFDNGVGDGLEPAGNGYLQTSTGDGLGTFASNPPPIPSTPTVPEPATSAAMGLGVLGIFGMMFRARKRSELSATA